MLSSAEGLCGDEAGGVNEMLSNFPLFREKRPDPRPETQVESGKVKNAALFI